MYLGYAAAWMDVVIDSVLVLSKKYLDTTYNLAKLRKLVMVSFKTTGFVGVAALAAFVQADYYIDPTTVPYATRGK
ncbi:hypothetical protein CRV24_003423 [Beauveria bassiana]|uniref:Uncharacterized protein n=1 Tax=Beauveria bassiana (strain ARSEF 2860) TaxID=655819 RepID=J4KNK6_BEAB2|nr:uncharacterized protein BBA_05280 [Beauveria bassiana ARSEF 2860]EJP65869.1 hypothetical protein BBA_05280 [Beauveria bassiana ARSEF 2860]KAF1737796.1 hypothetical protein CRV24_003423 [Beauveria bassiana]KAH8718831.1 hypothetical protein HC256_003460 [Beauveria bassiana]